MINILCKKFHGDAQLPSCKHESDAGRDLYSVEEVVLYANTSTIVSTGIGIQMVWKTGYSGESRKYKPFFKISSRSGLASTGIHVIGGIVDESYTGEIKVILANTSPSDKVIHKGDRIAQGIVELIPNIDSIDWINEFESTDRGADGFGSSGR